MEKDNGIGFETVSTDRISETTIGEYEGTDKQNRGDEDNTRRTPSDRRRRIKLRRKQRNGESRDSDDTRDTAGADATNATDTEEYDQENFIRVKQYQSSESKKSGRKREKSQNKKAIKLEDAVEQFLDTTFSIVSLLSSEPHWALEPSEREMLGDAVVAYIEAQDKKTLQRLRKVAGKYFPALNLAVVSFAIVYPRVLQSKIFLKKNIKYDI
jgi:hypothetical protein